MGHIGNGAHGQRGIMVNIKDTDGVPWGMGHMGNWAHHNFLILIGSNIVPLVPMWLYGTWPISLITWTFS